MVTRTTLLGGLLSTLLAAGCYDMPRTNPASRGPTSYTAVPIVPNADGWVAKNGNPLGIQGHFYVYGDQYDSPRTCTDVGGHPAQRCSTVESPTVHVPKLGFTNVDGRLCTIGTAAEVVACCDPATPGLIDDCEGSGADTAVCCAPTKVPCPGPDTLHDYSNMWGAGIGLDFDLEPADFDGTPPTTRDPNDRKVWSAPARRVVGVAFDLDWTSVSGAPEPTIRVEAPIRFPDGQPLPSGRGAVLLDGTIIEPDGDLPPGSTSEEHPVGSPFWRSGKRWEDTAVKAGHNELLFVNLEPPPDDLAANYVVDTTQLLGIQFHVPPLTQPAPLKYAFCISHLALLRE